MPSYYITWDIQIEADSPEDAAREALEIQRNPESIATVFTVVDEETNAAAVIDADEIAEQ